MRPLAAPHHSNTLEECRPYCEDNNAIFEAWQTLESHASILSAVDAPLQPPPAAARPAVVGAIPWENPPGTQTGDSTSAVEPLLRQRCLPRADWPGWADGPTCLPGVVSQAAAYPAVNRLQWRSLPTGSALSASAAVSAALGAPPVSPARRPSKEKIQFAEESEETAAAGSHPNP